MLNIHWKDWCWSWNSNTLATCFEELTHLKRPWCWERLKAGAEGDDRGWDGWMASPTWWTWVWVSFGSWWWTGKPGVLRSMGSQRVGHDWATELNYCSLGLVVFLLNTSLKFHSISKEEWIHDRNHREDRLGGSSKILLLVNEFTPSFNQQIFTEYHYVLGLMLGDPKVPG